MVRTLTLLTLGLVQSCFQRAHNAHERGDGAEAKQLSNEGHAHQTTRDRLNDQAADLIYKGLSGTSSASNLC